MKFRAEYLLLLWLLALFPGCHRGDMYDQPRYEAYEASSFFADGGSARPPVPGTVPRGAAEGGDLLHTGKKNGVTSRRFPFPLTRAGLDRGEERYRIHCAPCHGLTGMGRGMVVQRGFPKPPSFADEVIREKPVGHYFQVITAGFGVMPSYGAEVETRDRWLIAAYLRALQLAAGVPVGKLSGEARRKIEEEKR